VTWKLAPLATGLSILGLVFIFTAVFTTTGCGSGSTHARLMNAMSGFSSIDMTIDNKTAVTGTTYGAASGYVNVSSGSRNLIVESTGSTSPLINQSASHPAIAQSSRPTQVRRSSPITMARPRLAI
jgi:hypothetical protein